MGIKRVTVAKPRLSFLQIINMNAGFFGLQYAFGLQSANMTPIYSYLGAEPSRIPLLWLAGPVTGLLVQPIIGAMSDKTISTWGRRTPYFLIGAVISSLGLLVMPFSSALWMAASVLWILDIGANTTMEPYRAFVSDKLDKAQHNLGYLTQSAFAGMGSTLAFLTPTLLVLSGFSKTATSENNIPVITIITFMIGAAVMLGSVLWTIKTTREIPLTECEREAILKSPRGVTAVLGDLKTALNEMPLPMRQMIPMMFFGWYSIFLFMQYMPLCLAQSIYQDAGTFEEGLVNASLLWSKTGAFYFFVAFVSAFFLVPLANRYGAKKIHRVCLLSGGLGMFCVPFISDPSLLYIPMLGVGVYWASTMGITYVMLAGILPGLKTGIYMGIFNMFIVIPMIIQTLTVPLYYELWLGGSPLNAVHLAGILLVMAAVSVNFIDLRKRNNNEIA